MALLEVKELDVHYGAIQALHGVCLEVHEGQVVTILGANGAGKSTTLRAISGLQRPTAGSIVYDGVDITRRAPHRIVQAGIAQVPEGRGIFANLSVRENLALGGYIRRDKDAVRRDFDHAMDLLPRLRERLHQNAGTLSGGEQQMLAIARALLAKPRLLLLDEPSLGLAPQIVQTIFAIIRQISAQGTTVLLVEQNVHMALATAQMGYVLEVGRITHHAAASELAQSEEIHKAYLGT